MKKYASQIREEGRVDAALAADMGNYMFLACFPTLEELQQYVATILEEK